MNRNIGLELGHFRLGHFGFDAGPSARETGCTFGGGLQYAFKPSFLGRGKAERCRVNDAVKHTLDVSVLTPSLVFPFGSAETPAPCAMAPVYVAPLRRVSFSAESPFGFDESAVQPAGRGALEGFVRELEDTRFQTITVEGHTDRLGSPACDQTRSRERADALKSCLVTSGRIDRAKITAVGKGEGSAVTTAGACKGDMPSAALIGCLQPDRRVEIEVSGTR